MSMDVEITVLVSVREIVTPTASALEVSSANRETDTLESVDAVEEEEETGITVSVPLTGTELWLTVEESTTPDVELMPEEWLLSALTAEESTSPDVELLLSALTAEESTWLEEELMPLESVELEPSPTEDVLPLTAEESTLPEEELMPVEWLTSEESEPDVLEPSLPTAEDSLFTEEEWLSDVLNTLEDLEPDVLLTPEESPLTEEELLPDALPITEELEPSELPNSEPIVPDSLLPIEEESTLPDVELMPREPESSLLEEEPMPTDSDTSRDATTSEPLLPDVTVQIGRASCRERV